MPFLSAVGDRAAAALGIAGFRAVDELVLRSLSSVLIVSHIAVNEFPQSIPGSCPWITPPIAGDAGVFGVATCHRLTCS